MKFSDFVLKGAVIPNLKATDKQGVIAELVGALADPAKTHEANPAETPIGPEDLEPALDPADVDAVIDAVMAREEMGTTGVGRGNALPHAAHAAVKRLACAIGVSADGVDFDALDRQKVKLFFLFLCPDGAEANLQRLEALKYTARNLRDEGFVKFMQQCACVDDVAALLDDADAAA